MHCSTAYPVTPTLSVDAVQVRLIWEVAAVAVKPAGTLGDVVSGGELTVILTDCAVVPPAPVQESVYENTPVAEGVTVSEPESAFDPDHAPEAVQEVALEEDHVSVEDEPRVTEETEAVSATEGRGRERVQLSYMYPP
ncbi:hypothetical protein HY250_04230 [Candidatus Azambacteria bacterium]|nr:hypothetical protein [Candidatus Azambacteria bacterium]